MPEHDATEVTRPRQAVARLAVITIMLAGTLALVLAEITIRLLFPHHSPDTVRAHSIPYRQTVYSGYLIEPADRLIDLDQDKAWGLKSPDAVSENRIFVSANGYRGPGFAVRKPEGTYRIVVLGGSAVFDQKVSDSPVDHNASWPRRVDSLLRDRGFTDVEVINAGIPGQNSADSLGRLYTQLWTYTPDMVIVYHGWNDIKFWQRLAVSPETPLIERVATFDPRANPFMFFRGAVDRLLGHSQLYIRLRNVYFRHVYQPGSEGALPADHPLATAYGEFGPRQFRLNLELMVAATRAIGATPVVVTQATLLAANNTTRDRERIGYRYQGLDHNALLRAFRETYRIIEETAASHDIVVIDAAGTMNGTPEWFDDHVHTSPAGSAELARIVADGVAGILPGRPVP